MANHTKAKLNLIIKKAADYYHACLMDPKLGKEGREYLNNRGISLETIKKFNLGFAPDGWQNLDSLFETKDDKSAAIAAGLLVEKGNHSYSRFRNRIMFPIKDRVGRPISFGGRVLGDELPKYLNGPETKIFKKSDELYNLDASRTSEASGLIISEGYIDIITADEFGFDNSVASLGTAINEDQIERLSYIKDHLIFCFDGDKAGKRAATSVLEKVLISQPSINAQFVIFPDNQDMDSYIRTSGTEMFINLCEDAPDQYEFLELIVKEKFENSIIGSAKALEYKSTLGIEYPRP
jgi:DNA primase